MAFKTVSTGDRISEYVLREKLGQGGFGEVWKAEHTQIAGKFVAIKIPTRPESVTLLKNEAVFQHQLDHANIVRTIGLDLEHDPPYFIMEYVEGRNLRQFLGDEGIMPPPYAIDICVQMLEALSYAHSRSIVHKDIKPENVLVEKKKVKVAEHAKALMHYVKITDLGLGNVPDTRQSEMVMSEQARTSGVRMLSGTLFYMAPEQMISGRTVDPRADLYSVGVCLYEMLTGELPLGMDLPSELNPVVTPELDGICKKALSIDRDHRYQSAREMIVDLHRAKESFLVRLVNQGAPAAKMMPTGELKKVEISEPKPATVKPGAMPVVTGGTRKRGGTRVFEWTLVALVVALGALSSFAFVKNRKGDPAKNSQAPAATSDVLQFRIEAQPAGVEVLVDDQKAGTTPCDLTLTFDRHAVRLTKEFYADRVLELAPLSENGKRYFDVKDRTLKDTVVGRIELNDRAALRGIALLREKGSLRIDTPGVPEAVVMLDGREVGVTPLELREIDAGCYHVRITRDKFRPLDFDIKVPAGDAFVKSCDLQPEGTAKAPSPYHKISIATTPPGAMIFVNEMEKGRSPLEFELADGTYRLTLELKYHESYEGPIKVEGGTQTIKVPLARIRGRASFESEPAGAAVIVDGRDIGRTPVTATLDGGQHVAEFFLDGYFKKTMPFEVLVKDQLVPVHLAMQRIPQGMISVECEVPGAEVFVDDRSVGRVPVAQAKVDPGRHRVRILGFERDVDVEPGVDRKLSYSAKDLGMALVPAGDFLFGSPKSAPNETRIHKEMLPAYYVEIGEVTNERYAAFWAWMQRTGDHSRCDPNEGRTKNHKPKYWDDPQYKHLCDPKMPVVGVDWYDAVAYAAWAGKRLPTEKEWEKAARGTDGRAYPWGNDWDPKRLNWGDTKGETDGFETIAPVGSFATGASPYGCLDMAGNAAEWCADLYDPTTGGATRTVRGGSCIEKEWVRTWTRDFYAPNQLLSRLGFRCVVDAK